MTLADPNKQAFCNMLKFTMMSSFLNLLFLSLLFLLLFYHHHLYCYYFVYKCYSSVQYRMLSWQLIFGGTE